MTDTLPIKEVQEYELTKLQAGALFKSGMFPSLETYAQAVVKVMIGKEMGMSPFQSVSCIYMVSGKPEINARGIASLIAKHKSYSYRIIKATREICEIEFYDSVDKICNKDTLVGSANFTIQEAQEAGLLGKDNWKKYPSDMLFARALSRGCRRFAPDVFNGAPVYVEGELDADRPISKESIGIVELTAKQNDEDIITEKNIDSDAEIIDDIKKTHIISEEFR